MIRWLKRTALIFFVLNFAELAMAKDNGTKAPASSNDDAFSTIMSTKYNFEDRSISGGTQAPDDFFLRGKQPQSLSQMVRLRSGFKREHRNSRYGVKALTH